MSVSRARCRSWSGTTKWPRSTSARHLRRACASDINVRKWQRYELDEDWSLPGDTAQAGDEDQSTPVPGDGSPVHAAARPAAAYQAGNAEQPVPGPGGAAGHGRGDAGQGRAEGAREGEGAGRDRL